MAEVAKPPIGVAPEFIWREQNPNPDGRACRERAFALMDATRRYIAAGFVPRAEWVGELLAVAYDAGNKDAAAACTRAYHPTATVPGPTFAPLTADLRAPLNEAGERVGPARERRADADALVARLTAGDTGDEPGVVGS